MKPAPQDEPLKLGPDLGPLKANVDYLRRLVEALAEKQGLDIADFDPPPVL